LIQKWGLRYEKQDSHSLFFNVYKALLTNGVKFPDPPAKVDGKAGSSGGTDAQARQKTVHFKEEGDKRESPEDSKVPAKYRKLISDMNLVKGNINFTNEIIDGTKPGDRSNETLNDLFKTLTMMEPKLFGLIA
jgi:hypothetical protein